jgi:hypothetical protein
MAAWLGLVPKQYSSGGKQVLRRISKRGDGYLRRLLLLGARAVLRHLKAKPGQEPGGSIGSLAAGARTLPPLPLPTRTLGSYGRFWHTIASTRRTISTVRHAPPDRESR